MEQNEPSLELVWSTFTGYQRTAALKAALDLDVFTHIAAGLVTVDALAPACKAAPRGLRALLGHLAMDGFLTRDGDRYGLSATSAMMLDRNSATFVGSAAEFIASPMIMETFSRLTDAIRRGGTAVGDEGTLEADHPVWVQFARAMAPLARMTGMLVGNLLDVERAPGWKVLDIA
ncbi:MAG TPA: hypothetical protein VMT89_12405, partial [Candidatus Acidoferrales bacterium]|nr:hypothetical protein [Candidatus Acidoferrales bacterium]